MGKPKILSIYLFTLYCYYFASILLIVIGVLLLSNIFDVLQKFKSLYIPNLYFWKLVVYRTPYLLNEVSCLISFVAILFLLRRLTKYNELLSLLCSGIPIWRIISMPIFASIIFGIVIITLCNPLATFGLKKYEDLGNYLSNNVSGSLRTSKTGFLFLEKYHNIKKILQTQEVDVINNKLINITLLILDNNNNFIERIDAPYAILINNNLKIISAKIYNGKSSEIYDQLDLPTTFSMKKLSDNVTNPAMVSIWELPSRISQLIETGIPVINYQIYYYKQLFKPIIMGIMVVLGSCFFSLNYRNNSQNKILIVGLFIGLITYFFLEASFKMLSYSPMPPFMAVLLPNVGILLLSNFFLNSA